ncbi:tRNA (adenosine(37)-N6)-threonylcarbamoyltransferase complex transferase subunit TsaD [Candidatus Parcubacteria bacterium]|nr:MAG: tRNA (adenosine(37)-N6)-threonylcarbamoyltransferase complex transferase subunit TsaD [Candidatus Parcubacteria bacterium]
MKILAIETSCDETSIAIVEAWMVAKNTPKFKIVANTISSQVKLHAQYGGVVPNLASREHLKNLIPVFEETLKKASIKKQDIPKKIQLLAVTVGPGLIPSLIVGVNFAKTLGLITNLPIVGTNHLEGHIYSNWLDHSQEINFPALNLIVSGGHTQLVLMKDCFKYRLLGETRDDAAGEAFDKIARLLGLGYPGGPAIDKASQNGNPEAFKLPRPMIDSKDFEFSFAGLKTAVLYMTRTMTSEEISQKTPGIAASAQQAIVDVLISKTLGAAQQYKAKTIMVSGGVAANKKLREILTKKSTVPAFFPPIELATDNAAMIAMAAYFNFLNKKSPSVQAGWPWEQIEADSNLQLKTS